jgi:hypothetical protein
MSGKAASAYGAATSNAGNQYARATDAASQAVQESFNEAVSTWTESRLKAYLDARGIVCVNPTSERDTNLLTLIEAGPTCLEER